MHPKYSLCPSLPQSTTQRRQVSASGVNQKWEEENEEGGARAQNLKLREYFFCGMVPTGVGCDLHHKLTLPVGQYFSRQEDEQAKASEDVFGTEDEERLETLLRQSGRSIKPPNVKRRKQIA